MRFTGARLLAALAALSGIVSCADVIHLPTAIKLGSTRK
jgi:hypothetical protein